MKDKASHLVKSYLKTDKHFNQLYPIAVQVMSERHWTPLHIAMQAASFLGERAGSKILDIGSGVGKFCLAAAVHHPQANFFGIEQRAQLVNYALIAKQILNVKNASFTHGNFTQLDLHNYDHFYFFNSFYENLDDDVRIDNAISYSEGLYEYYSLHLYNKLRRMPSGTRIATYHTFWHEIPREYKIVESLENGELNFWIRR